MIAGRSVLILVSRRERSYMATNTCWIVRSVAYKSTTPVTFWYFWYHFIV